MTTVAPQAAVRPPATMLLLLVAAGGVCVLSQWYFLLNLCIHLALLCNVKLNYLSLISDHLITSGT